MRIIELSLGNVRNVESARLKTDSPLILISGDNAAGKTSLLEALHLLLAGRSFRTREWGRLIQHGKARCMVTAQIGEDFVGCSRSRGEPIAHRLNSEQISLGDVARRFPLMLFDNGAFDLFEGPPQYRRRVLDWGLFHVKHEFYQSWRRYNLVLRQRGALLKRGPSLSLVELDAWDRELAEAGASIHACRSEYAEHLQMHCRSSPLLNEMDLSWEYFPGWFGSSESGSLSEVLQRNRERDIQHGRTTAGPHHADIKIRAHASVAGDVLSRGQKKLAAFALKLEQVRMYNSCATSRCILLFDDMGAELDPASQKKILSEALDLGGQVFVTCIEPAQIKRLLSAEQLGQAAMFHVKHGAVDPVAVTDS